MDTSGQNIQELFERWFNNLATPQEEAALFELLNNTSPADLQPAMKELWDQLQADTVYTTAQKDSLVDKILEQHKHQEAPLRAASRHYLWRAAAAIIFLLGTAGLYWILTKQLRQQAPVNISQIGPGKNGAILKLADGTEVVLDSLHNGVVATQHQSQLVLHNGSLSYQLSPNATTDTGALAEEYNTMITPRGRQFEVVLPDGTKVSLNAASTLRFPAAFTGKERRVELKGEAYFEVAANPQQPFKVSIDAHHTIEVLGTHFNVNAYADEQQVRTTLLEGAIQVHSFDAHKKIAPGQEAVVTNTNPQILVQPADIEASVAWKNGVFDFNNADVQVVMRQLSRWYDVEIVYEKGIPDIKIWGKMQRNLKLEQVLKILSGMELKYRLENGRKLIILP